MVHEPTPVRLRTLPASIDPNFYAHVYNSVADRPRIRILDSTLREGEQHAGVSFTTKQWV